MGLVMGQNKFFATLFLALGVCIFGGVSEASSKNLPICYVPGAGGVSEDVLKRFPKELAQRGIQFIIFDIGNVGTVVERASKLARLLEVEVNKNESFRCHFFAYSMGGVVSRYFYNHSELLLKSGKRLDGRSLMASLTTYSSPHRGTPLADWLLRYAPKYAAGMGDLSEERIQIYNDPAYPETYSPTPSSIPVYSYLTYLEKAEESNEFLGKFGFKIIWETYKSRKIDPRNDGIVPQISQALGKVVMSIRAPHGFFSSDLGLRPWAPDVYELQYHTLNGSLSEMAQKGRLEALLSAPHVSTEGLESLQNLNLGVPSSHGQH
jgi:triacylglycerol esterase/lipase EstA (alpha/beta hydrolase family)